MELLKYQGNLFKSAAWFQVLARTTNLEPVILYDDRGLIPCKKVGGRLSSLTNFYSVEFSPLGDYGGLLGRVGPMFDMHYLTDDMVERVFQDHGFRTFRQPQYAHWICPIETGFEAYFKARPSQLKNTLKRKSKALMAQHKLDLKILLEPSDAFTEVYNESWKLPEQFPNFIPELLDITSKLEVLRLGVAYIDGEPAAAQLWIVESGKATIYKLAYKEKFKDTSVGTVLSHEMFRYAIDVDGVKLIDYGIGDEPYKKDWMTQRDEVFQLTCFDRSVSGRLMAFGRSAKHAMQR